MLQGGGGGRFLPKIVWLLPRQTALQKETCKRNKEPRTWNKRVSRTTLSPGAYWQSQTMLDGPQNTRSHQNRWESWATF